MEIPTAGQILGSYELLGEIDRGGMGVVYRARDLALDRLVAVKMLRSGAFANETEVQRFHREAQAAARLRHPHIVPIFHVGNNEGLHYFGMAYMPGGSLFRKLHTFRGKPEAAAAFMAKVADAVHFAHQQGILHRDLKPGNILLDERGEPHVSDFGLAKITDAENELTQTGAVLGTPAYMAPEQARGQTSRIGPATDIWALGVILYELLTGRRPFKGDSREAVTDSILNLDPPRPSTIEPRLDHSLEGIVIRCLDKEPEGRYPSAGLLAEDLRCWQKHELTSLESSAHSRSRRLRRRDFLVAGTVSVLGIGGLGAAWSMNRHDTNAVLKVPVPERLRRGESVVLIGAQGLPEHYDWIINPGGIQDSEQLDQGFVFHTNMPTLLELLPNPGIDRYRFRASIRHDQSFAGRVGLYVLRTGNPSNDGLIHSCCTLAFADMGSDTQAYPAPDGTKVSAVRLQLRYSAAAWKQSGSTGGTDIQELFASPVAPGVKPPWRALAIEVSPLLIRVFWEGRSIGEITTERLHQLCRQMTLANPNPLIRPIQASLSPRGGLGLFAFGSTASFKNVIIEPLS